MEDKPKASLKCLGCKKPFKHVGDMFCNNCGRWMTPQELEKQLEARCGR